MDFSWFYIFFLSSWICLDSVFSAISYNEHCSSIVPESAITIPSYKVSVPKLTTNYFTGGEKILAWNPGSQAYVFGRKSLTVQILPDYYETIAISIYKVRGFLYIEFPEVEEDDTRRQRRSIRFSVNGFWSDISRRLCMVGSASWEVDGGSNKIINLEAVLKLNYANEDNQTIYTSVISGSLESVSSTNDPGYFDPIIIFCFSAFPGYNYALVSKEVGVFSSKFDIPRNRSLNLGTDKFCNVVAWRSTFLELEYAMECREHQHCSPIRGVELIGSSLPRYIHLSPIQCSDNERKLRYTATYRNISYEDRNFNMDSMVIGEATWDDKKNVLFGIACRLLDPLSHFGNAVGDCTMRFALRYPSILTIRNEDRVVGQFWSSKTVTELGYFRKIGITSSDDNGDVIFPGRRYEYTELDNAKKLCPMKEHVKKRNTYPDVRSYNMRFDMSVKDSKGKDFGRGYATPLCVGNDLHQGYSMVVALSPESASDIAADSVPDKTNASPISYIMILYPVYQFNSSWFPSLSLSKIHENQVEITAEGVYDGEKGYLCMVGCRKVVQNSVVSRDCEILLKFEYASSNGKRGGLTKGTIQSTRPKTDTLYFDELVLQSAAYYVEEATRSLWRMDLEITIILVSNTLVCIFVGLQILHVKRNPEVPSFISIIMLVILSAGNMIPLVLNFESVSLRNHSTEINLTRNGGRIESNEVTVRVINLVAFLLQMRLLQLVWSAKKPSSGERRAVFVSVLVYILGGLLTWLLNSMRNKYVHQESNPYNAQQNHPLWGDLRSYEGLILDGFLLPQILLNIFHGSADQALSPVFYIGISIVRLVPHVYNQYRRHNYPAYDLKKTYYYANTAAGFSSTASDIIVSCAIILFSVVVFLQQRHSGRCFLP